MVLCKETMYPRWVLRRNVVDACSHPLWDSELKLSGILNLPSILTVMLFDTRNNLCSTYGVKRNTKLHSKTLIQHLPVSLRYIHPGIYTTQELLSTPSLPPVKNIDEFRLMCSCHSGERKARQVAAV